MARRAAKFTNLPIYQIYHCPESVLSLASCLTQWRLRESLMLEIARQPRPWDANLSSFLWHWGTSWQQPCRAASRFFSGLLCHLDPLGSIISISSASNVLKLTQWLGADLTKAADGGADLDRFHIEPGSGQLLQGQDQTCSSAGSTGFQPTVNHWAWIYDWYVMICV